MTDLDLKQNQQTEWLRQFTLTNDQFKQLVLNKIKRAAVMQLAVRKRENSKRVR